MRRIWLPIEHVSRMIDPILRYDRKAPNARALLARNVTITPQTGKLGPFELRFRNRAVMMGARVTLGNQAGRWLARSQRRT